MIKKQERGIKMNKIHINRISKGNRSEKRTEKWLQNIGFLIETVKRPSRISKQNKDFFRLWDHIAICIRGHSTDQWKYGTMTPRETDLRIASIRMGLNSPGELINYGDTIYVQTRTNQKRIIPQEAYEFPARLKFLFLWKDNLDIPIIYFINSEDYIPENKTEKNDFVLDEPDFNVEKLLEKS